jgi:hypothetical protein
VALQSQVVQPLGKNLDSVGCEAEERLDQFTSA